MTTFETRNIQRTRRPHRCYGCNRLFPTGSSMIRDSYIDDKKIAHSYWCPSCNEIVSQDDFELDLLYRGELGYWEGGVWHYYGDDE